MHTNVRCDSIGVIRYAVEFIVAKEFGKHPKTNEDNSRDKYYYNTTSMYINTHMGVYIINYANHT
jgi:hypothetical protein